MTNLVLDCMVKFAHAKHCQIHSSLECHNKFSFYDISLFKGHCRSNLDLKFSLIVLIPK
jgi:hypothetical protein